MLTLRAKFHNENSTQTLACHIFQQEKDPYSAWLTGRDLILEKIDEMDIQIDRIVRVSLIQILLSFCAHNETRWLINFNIVF